MRYANPADMPSRSEAEQADFFEQAFAASEEALRRSECIEHDMMVAGRRIRLRFGGEALARLTLEALSPLFVPLEGTPDASLIVWDGAGTGVEMPAPTLSNLCFSERGDLWTFDSARYRSAFHYWDYSLNLFDRKRALGIFWLKDAAKMPSWTRAAPFRTLFHWLLADHGLQLVHGAVVGTERGGILICGAGGVGKSSTALAALASGMRFVGDDYVVLSMAPGAEHPVTGHALFASAKVHFPDAPRFQSAGRLMQELAPRGADDKAVIFPEDAMTASLPIVAMVTPRFGDTQDSSFEPIDRDALLMAAAYPTLIQLPHSGHEVIEFLERVAGEVPTGRLVLGSDRMRVPHALRHAIAEPAATFTGPAPQPPGTPLVSVIIPAYNAQDHIRATIENVRDQTHQRIEIIVVDDGSTDETVREVEAVGGPIRLVRQNNAGPAAARNRGIEEARGDYLCFQDADDLWPRWKITSALSRFADDPDCDVVLGRSQLVRGDSASGNQLRFKASPLDTFEWSIGAAVFRADVFQKVGRFDTRLRFGEDTDWFERAAEIDAGIERIEEISLYVRRHETNSTKNRDVKDIYPIRLIHKRVLRERQARRDGVTQERQGKS